MANFEKYQEKIPKMSNNVIYIFKCFFLFYLFSKSINGLLNVRKVHGLDIADHWYNKTLYIKWRDICYLLIYKILEMQFCRNRENVYLNVQEALPLELPRPH